MDFKSFLKSVKQPEFWKKSQNFCFKGSDFSPLFFNSVFGILDKTQLLPYPKKVLTAENLKNDYHAQLEQSILGCYNFFWLGDLSEHSKNTKLLNYIFNYQGPHTIAFFVSGDSKVKLCASAVQIDINSTVTIDEVRTLISILTPKLSDKKITMVGKIFDGRRQIELDSACMLINYFELMNINSADETCEYLTKIFGEQPALSQLSNAFWTKNSKEFFKIWHEIGSSYPDVFWVIFWSEQIWKAFHTISYLNQKNFIKAKQASYGLPYSFINRDFNNFKPAELVKFYENLYDIDFAIKKGSTFYSLDLFYLNYFNANR